MGRYRIPIDMDDLVRRYTGGESEQALAKAFGVDRGTIRGRLLKAGVERRGSSEASHLRMARLTPEQRAANASAAHDAKRGTVASLETKLAHAATVESLGADWTGTSPAELMLAGMLRDAGLTVIPQKAVGPYNVDVATSSVAVEILGGSWHRVKKHGERLRYILDAGWDVIYVWVDVQRFPLTARAGEYVIAHCQFRDGHPAAPRCYRVIRGGGEFVAGGSADGDGIPDIIPVNDRPDVAPAEVPYGFCHCGCGRQTTVSPKDWPLKGYVAGEPRRFISGHNSQRHAG